MDQTKAVQESISYKKLSGRVSLFPPGVITIFEILCTGTEK